MDHLEIVGQVGREQFFNEPAIARADRPPCALADDQARLVGGCAGLAEEDRDRHLEEPRHAAQIVDRRRGQIALDLTDPADRTAELVGQFLKRDPARLAQGADVRPQSACFGWRIVLHGIVKKTGGISRCHAAVKFQSEISRILAPENLAQNLAQSFVIRFVKGVRLVAVDIENAQERTVLAPNRQDDLRAGRA